MTYREALRRALDEELARDPNVFLMGEEIGRFEGSYKVTAGLWAKYGGKRVRETPISEEGFVGAGVGAAMIGLRPVVEIMTINFIVPAMDMVVNHAAKVRSMFGGKVGVPMVIRTPGGAGAQLTAQHSQSLEAWFAHVPGLKVVAPSNPWDAYGMLKTAIRDDDPVLFVENLYDQWNSGPFGMWFFLTQPQVDGAQDAFFDNHLVQIGDGVYAALAFEGGTHQVKRVPATEAQGRVHTSTATVAILAEPFTAGLAQVLCLYGIRF